MTEKIEALKLKLKNSNISFKEIIPPDPEISSRIIFDIPAGREKFQCVLVYRDELLSEALSVDFEKFRFILGYEGVWSKDLNIIEAEITNNEFMGRFFFDRLHKLICRPERNEDEENETEVTNIPLPNIGDVELSIGFCSPEFAHEVFSRPQIVGCPTVVRR